mmetsp:Transcript_39832/g.71623  ORF Transcript_39832/g.71623 Transcript_39832/m.71623 type:complete len:111 (+) Transcript_39832:198-530(+)
MATYHSQGGYATLLDRRVDMLFRASGTHGDSRPGLRSAGRVGRRRTRKIRGGRLILSEVAPELRRVHREYPWLNLRLSVSLRVEGLAMIFRPDIGFPREKLVQVTSADQT